MVRTYCPWCHEEFVSDNAAVEHMKTCNAQSRDMPYSTNSSLIPTTLIEDIRENAKRIKAKGEDVPPFECPYCSFRAIEELVLLKHLHEKHQTTFRQLPHPQDNSILLEAHRVVRQRRDNYGGPQKNFERIAGMWTQILGRFISPTEVGLCMIAVKLARHVHKPARDNLVDIAGYADCIAIIEEGVDHGTTEPSNANKSSQSTKGQEAEARQVQDQVAESDKDCR